MRSQQAVEVPRHALAGLRVVSFESRRAAEIAELIRRYGGTPILAPSMREVPRNDDTRAVDYLSRLAAGEIEIVVLMTGVGLRMLLDAAADQWPRDRVVAALKRATLVARGPKPVAALRALGLRPDVTIPEPNTWREILATLDAQLPVAGKRVAVQEYGTRNDALLQGLGARGAHVERVSIYRWALPADLGPLRAAISAVRDGEIDIALFTSATQVSHLFQVASAEAEDGAERLRAGFARVLIASIGPVCSQAIRAHGLSADLEPAHAKMGQLVAEVARRGRQLLDEKRSFHAA
ncbi:MAG: uroporphyrinogen-III synthase [Candidatus Binatia bacterium]